MEMAEAWATASANAFDRACDDFVQYTTFQQLLDRTEAEDPLLSPVSLASNPAGASADETEPPSPELPAVPDTEEPAPPLSALDQYHLAMAAESSVANMLGIRWRDRGPPTGPASGFSKWRGQKWREGSKRWANRGGANRDWYRAFYSGATSTKGKDKNMGKGKGTKGTASSSGKGSSSGQGKG